MKGNKSQRDVVAMKPLNKLKLKYSDWLSQERTTELFYRGLSIKPHH